MKIKLSNEYEWIAIESPNNKDIINDEQISICYDNIKKQWKVLEWKTNTVIFLDFKSMKEKK